MLRPLARLTLAALTLLAFDVVGAAADTRTAQLGGGFEASIRCDGSRLSYQRRDPRSVRLYCRDGSPRRPSRSAEVEAVALERGEEMRVLCQGSRLKTRRTGRNEVRATCASLI